MQIDYSFEKLIAYLGMIIAFFAIISLYFLPTIISDKKKFGFGIFVFNLFLGWTFIGWVIALVWALRLKAPAKW
jgi:hypothetical protein